MVIALAFTAVYHYVLERKLRPLYEFLPVSLEDAAAEAEQQHFLTSDDRPSTEGSNEDVNDDDVDLVSPVTSSEKTEPMEELNDSFAQRKRGYSTGGQSVTSVKAAANARRTLLRLRKQVATRLANDEVRTLGRTDTVQRAKAADQLGAAIATYPDELSDLSHQERDAELKMAYQDPVVRLFP